MTDDMESTGGVVVGDGDGLLLASAGGVLDGAGAGAAGSVLVTSGWHLRKLVRIQTHDYDGCEICGSRGDQTSSDSGSISRC